MARVAKEIARHRTVVWPNSDDFKKAIETRSLYGVGITKFIILEYDKSLKGDSPKDIPWIEHILSTTPDNAWFEAFSRVEHEEMKDRLANLLPLSSQMNITLSNKLYTDKRPKFRGDSMFKSTRQFAENTANWNPLELKKRASVISEWALRRWPHERPKLKD